jgi:hypothetical protein
MEQFLIAALTAQKISLEARLQKAEKFYFNSNMQVECILLRAQIQAIDEKLKT